MKKLFGLPNIILGIFLIAIAWWNLLAVLPKLTELYVQFGTQNNFIVPIGIYLFILLFGTWNIFVGRKAILHPEDKLWRQRAIVSFLGGLLVMGVVLAVAVWLTISPIYNLTTSM